MKTLVCLDCEFKATAENFNINEEGDYECPLCGSNRVVSKSQLNRR